MRIAMALLAVSLAFGSTACKKKEKPVTDNSSMTGSGSATAGSADTGSAGSANTMAGSGSAGSGDAMAGYGSGAGSAEQMPKRGGNCPSTVAGSTTKAELKDGKILLTITSDDKDAIAAIQKRTTELLKEKTDGGAPGTGHDQKGTHGGGMGLCPVHLDEGGTATSKTDPKGVVITITPKGKADILKGEIDSRITKAAEYVKANVKPGDEGTTGGVGGGKGEHGSNRKGSGDGTGKGDGKGGGKGTGGGGGGGTGGGGSGSGSAAK